MMAARPGGRAGVRTPALVLLVIVCGILPSLLTGALAVQIRQDLGMGPAAVGLATSYFFGAGALGSLLLGRLTERIGPAAALRLAALLSMCSSLGIAAAATTASRLFLFLAVSGFANAVAHPAANVALLDAVDPSRYGLVFGIKQSAVPVAALFAGAAVPAIALTVGWRYAFVAGGVVSLVVGALIPLVIAKTKMTERQKKIVRRLTVGRGPMATLTIAAGLASMASNSLGMFLVLSAIDAGLGVASAGILLSVSSGLGIAVRVITGWLADRVGQGRLTAVAVLILTGAVGFGLLAIPAPLPAVVGSLVGFALGWGWPGLFNLAVARANPDAPATATGVIQTGIYMGAATGPLLFGVLAETRSFSFAWSIMTGLALVGGVLMIFGRRGVLRERARRAGAAN